MFHREGQKIIIGTFFLVVAISIAAQYFVELEWLRIAVQLAALVLLVLILQFFRNPKRPVTPSFDEILAPVDGKVVAIEEVDEPEYFKDKRRQVSIFMSPVNVHVTRYAASGTVTYSKYHPGKYLVAWHPKSSDRKRKDYRGSGAYTEIRGYTIPADCWSNGQENRQLCRRGRASHTRTGRGFYQVWF